MGWFYYFSLSDSSGLIDEININGNGLQTCNIFENLSPIKLYIICGWLRGCIITEEIEIESADPILVAFDTNPAQCFDNQLNNFIDNHWRKPTI